MISEERQSLWIPKHSQAPFGSGLLSFPVMYFSAIFNCMPKWATAFYAAVRRRDPAFVAQEMRDFLVPYLAIHDRRKGYAVSIVKAGVRLAGYDCGPVRTPLSDLAEEETAQLKALIGDRR